MSTLRERTREAVRDEVLTSAWLLFADNGFERTTVDQIAESAGMSRRSFFRYFATKEELILIRLIEHDEKVAAMLSARPAEEGAWTAVRAALVPMLEAHELQRERSLALIRMMREPGLRSTLAERERRWVTRMAPLVAKRLPRTTVPFDQDPRPLAVAGAAITCLSTAQAIWAVHPDKSLPRLLDRAMSAFEVVGS
ncbi:TetR/AcrR family transcriptional regulator [Nocardioides sp. Bht2]|uniref:TetR/AcrR family transcriptional regulator n=1 Tax=Nocardioides sp. Bht2 TaxID=3392297 RepID=UPI0039B50F35